jgi:alkane 1-monooxygenase
MPPAVARARETLRIWTLHLLCFVLPVTSLVFLATAPHPGWRALPWMLVLIGSVVADVVSGPERRQPAASLPGWPFDAVLYVLVAMQLAIMALLVRLVAVHGFWRVDTAVAFFLIGVNSGYSAIVVAHELVHRPKRHMELLGRVLLCTVLYEHFSTEHVRGHHVRVATPEDPATARFGETGIAFLLRTIPGQFRSAWRLETKRLGDEDMPWWDTRLLRSRVVHGLVAEWALAFGILAVAGPGAFAIFLLQAAFAVRLLEAVNYLEHWGLVRRGRNVTPLDSWDTDSSFTLYTLVGLSRHADHHAHASRPYPQLRWVAESPKLPTGYFGTVLLLIVANARFRALMTLELRRRRLGPFAPADA